ncbi:MAG: hypothetical protein KDB80_01205 [Planctomycetes bacterium]|nr:hypothetical protein [Planctomycetota bacterium]
MTEQNPTESTPASPEPVAEPAAPVAASTSTESDPGETREARTETADPETSPKRRRRRRRRRKPTAGTESDGSPAESSPEEAKDGKRRRKPRARPKAKPTRGRRDEHHALTAVRELAQMAQELLEIENVDFLSRPRFMDVQLRIPLDVKRDGKRSASSVVEKILERVREVREHDRALVPGAAYCYFSESASSDSARPTEPRQVFDGYTSTGRPQFTDFVTMAIERKDPGVDALVDGEDIIVTHVTLGRVLRTQQLAEFGKGSPVYRILGQVDAGLYPVVNGPHKAAFSFQLLRGKTLEGKPRLRLHPVGMVDVTDLADPSVAEILRRFQQRLDAESLRLAGKEANAGEVQVDDEEFVLPLLQDLARRLAGRARHTRNRTGHAVQRVEEGQRPTTKAFADAKEAGDEQIYEDDHEGTIVIVGPRGRVHVFARDARHVTSFMMTGSNVQKRRGEGRWRQADPALRGEFRIALRKFLAKSEEADGEGAPATDEGGPVESSPGS